MDLQNEFAFVRENLNERLNDCQKEVIELTGLLAEKEETLNLKLMEINELESKVKILSDQLRNCMETWNNDKEGFVEN